MRSPSFQAQNPLVEQIGKEGYNTISEMRAAIDGRACHEACQIVVSMANRNAGELVPDGDDPRLLTSLALAADAEARSSPELLKTLASEFAAVGRLRLGQATGRGDARRGGRHGRVSAKPIGRRGPSLARRPAPIGRAFIRGGGSLPQGGRRPAGGRARRLGPDIAWPGR